MGVSQARTLGIHLRQVRLPNRQPREVQPAQVAAQKTQQIDDVAGPIALLHLGPAAPRLEQREQQLLRAIFAVLRRQQLQDRRTDQPFLSLPHVVLGLGLDERLLHELQRLSARDPVGHVLHEAVGYVLQHYRLQRERSGTGGPGPLQQRTPAQRLDGLQDCPAVDAWAQVRDQLGQAHRVPLNGQHSQQLPLERRAPPNLLRQQTSDATKHRAGSRLAQKHTDVAIEHLTDALADHLQRQDIATESGNQLGPILVSARELLVGQQHLTFANAETAELELAYPTTAENG